MFGKTSRLEIRIDNEFKERLEKIAKSQGKTISDVIRDLINFYVNVADVTNVDIKKLVEEALKRPAESKYLLRIETWVRQGASFTDYRDYRVVYGDVTAVELERIDQGYPYRIIMRYVIFPKTIPTILVVREYSDIPGFETDEVEIYVFTKDGWKRISVR